MKKNEVANTEGQTFDLALMSGDIAQAIAEELDGLGNLTLDIIKFPSGGGISFEVPGEDEDDVEAMTKLRGVILHHQPVNVYWQTKFEDKAADDGNAPDCVAYDGHTGFKNGSDQPIDCKDCPFNQFGSGDGGIGKACVNKHRIYLLLEGQAMPYLLTLPPTSLKSFRKYLTKSVVTKGKRAWEVVTEIGLKKTESTNGITYSVATFKKVGDLSPEQAEQAKGMGETFKAANDRVDITETEKAETAAASDGDFVDIPEGEAADLPF